MGTTADDECSACNVPVDDSLSDLAKEWLREHNKYRCRHGVPPVVWDQEIADGSQAWAERFKDGSRFFHDESYQLTPPQGENGAWWSAMMWNDGRREQSPDATVANAVKNWYDEVANCEWPGCTNNPAPLMVGHFTALIWKGMTTIGCSDLVLQDNSGTQVVCRYTNVAPNLRNDGEYEANVFNINDKCDD